MNEEKKSTFTLWNEIEKQLKKNENQDNLEYTIDILNYITQQLYENHKNYWKIPIEERKYFLKELTRDILNGNYMSNDKKWSETPQRKTNEKRKRSNQEDQNQSNDGKPTDNKSIHKGTSRKKTRINLSENRKKRNDKSKQ